MRKTIVIPTDFSENATKAWQYFSSINQDEEFHFVLLHAYEPVGSLMHIDDLLETNKYEQLKSEAIRIKNERGDLEDQFTFVVERLNPEKLIVKAVKEYGAYMVVMGTRGATDDHFTSMGSTTSKVISSVQCPVLVVPEVTSVGLPKKILLSVDFVEGKTKNKIESVTSLARKSDAEVLILYVRKNGELSKIDLAPKKEFYNQLLSGIDHSFDIIQNTEIFEGIYNYSHNKNIDLLVMMPRKRDSLLLQFEKSYTREMALFSDIPLLTIPE